MNARLKQWKSAADDFQSAQKLAPHDTMHWMRAGVMLLLADDMAGYRDHAKEMLERFEIPPNAYAAERTAKLLVLPTEALVKYRFGDFDSALQLIEISETRNRPGERRPEVAQMLNRVVEGLCWAAKGDRDKAKAALEKADEYLKPFRIRPTNIDDSSRHDWFTGQLLYDEATRLVE